MQKKKYIDVLNKTNTATRASHDTSKTETNFEFQRYIREVLAIRIIINFRIGHSV